MYIHHTLIAWARLLWSRPQTTSHVVLVRPRARAVMELWPYGTSPSKRRSTCAKDRARAKMGHEQSKRDRAKERRQKQRDIASEESKAKAKNLTDTRTTLRSLSETFQTTALLSSPLYLVPSTKHIHATRGYNGYLLA